MTSKRFLIFAFFMCVLAFWFISRPTQSSFSRDEARPAKKGQARVPASQTRPVIETPFAKEEDSLNKPRPTLKRPPEGADLHDLIRKARLKAVGSVGASYKSYRERLDLKAAPAKMYTASLGNKWSQIGGYALYSGVQGASTINQFDGFHMPVVVDDHSHLGVVNGDIRVRFTRFPHDVEAFANEYGMKVVQVYPPLRLAFFTPKNYPAAMVDRVEELGRHPDVKNADLDIIFRTRVAQ